MSGVPSNAALPCPSRQLSMLIRHVPAGPRTCRAEDIRDSYAQVADELGYSSQGAAHSIVAKALRDQTAEAIASLHDLETARLDGLQLAM